MSGVIISGMHHSGTSVVTGILASANWHTGKHLIPKDERLQKEFWEDQEFVRINQEWLKQSNSNSDLPNDWGILETSVKEVSIDSNAISLAKKYVDERSRIAEHWIAKDPRSSITLPIWERIPNLKFVLIYRNPWDVVESLMRYGSPFSGNSSWALDVWKTYNLKLLQMKEILGKRCLLVSSDSVIRNPKSFYETFSNWIGHSIGEIKPEKVVNPNLFRSRPEGSEISNIFQVLHPEEFKILRTLDREAEVPSPRISQAPSRLMHGGYSKTSKSVQVIVPCRNDGQFLSEALASVEIAAASSVIPVELTIVDSFSEDENSLQIFDRLRVGGYQVVKAKKEGLPAARNLAIKESKAEMVIPLDSDNRLLPAMLRNTQYIIEGKADIVYGQWIRFGLDNRIHTPPQKIDWNTITPHNTLDNCAIVSRKILRKLKGWDMSLVNGLEDWDLWLRALSVGARFHYVPEPFFHYFVRTNSMTWHASQDLDKSNANFLKVARIHLKRARKAGADTSFWENQLL